MSSDMQTGETRHGDAENSYVNMFVLGDDDEMLYETFVDLIQFHLERYDIDRARFLILEDDPMAGIVEKFTTDPELEHDHICERCEYIPSIPQLAVPFAEYVFIYESQRVRLDRSLELQNYDDWETVATQNLGEDRVGAWIAGT